MHLIDVALKGHHDSDAVTQESSTHARVLQGLSDPLMPMLCVRDLNSRMLGKTKHRRLDHAIALHGKDCRSTGLTQVQRRGRHNVLLAELGRVRQVPRDGLYVGLVDWTICSVCNI